MASKSNDGEIFRKNNHDGGLTGPVVQFTSENQGHRHDATPGDATPARRNYWSGSGYHCYPGEVHRCRWNGLGLIVVFVVLTLSCCGHATPAISEIDSHRVSKEYCNMETFNATCRPGQVVLIESARYGRMNIGRCVKVSYGYLGCAADARKFMESRCSGRRSCRFVVPDPILYAMQPCPGDFTSYLDTAYSCVEALHGDKATCERYKSIRAISSSGYFTTSSPTSAAGGDVDRGPGSAACPWVIEAQRGQRINLTMFNFAETPGPSASTASSGQPGSGPGPIAGIHLHVSDASGHQRPGWKPPSGPEVGAASVGNGNSYGPPRTEVCFEIAEVVDGEFGRKKVTLCGDDRRAMPILWSRSNIIRIELANPKLLQSIGAFVFHYHVTGCSDVRLAGDMWQQPSQHHVFDHLSQQQLQLPQQHAVLRCNATDETWTLTCREGRWIGDVGNCSGSTRGSWSLEHMINQESTFPLGVLMAVTIGVAMGVVIGGVMLCLLTLYMKRHRRNLSGYSQPKEQRDAAIASSAFQQTSIDHSPFGESLRNTPPMTCAAVLGGLRQQHPHHQCSHQQQQQQHQQSPYSSTSSTATGIGAAYYFRRLGSADPSIATCYGLGSTATRSTCSTGVDGSGPVLATFGVGSRGHREPSDDQSAVVCCGGHSSTISGDVTSGSNELPLSPYGDDVVGVQTSSFGYLPSSSRQPMAMTNIGVGGSSANPPKSTYMYSGQLVT